ncbi:MAG: thioesterase domain-containing protein [Saprospiraceae bacterium]|nr:thioesterase domain-containing protein [Saprospiraceae bacterium]MDZ4703290.1 thioesterase domain-containing protein [Saprospiraceae bacterium]
MKNTVLFCIPFAGGNKYSYTGFQRIAPSHLELIALELPGRGKRLTEECLTHVDQMVADILPIIRQHAGQPYAIYGHSLGSLLAYLVAKKIIKENLPRPLRLILTGRGGASVKRMDTPRYLLEKEAFIESLREMGGMSEVLESEELMEFFEPIIRADLQAAETYEYEAATPFDIPVTVMIGDGEGITIEEANAWQSETTSPIVLNVFPGNHFFIFDHEQEIMQIIGDQLFG